MTLDTRIYVRGQIDHKALFLKCNQLIGAHEHVKAEDSQDDWPVAGDDNPWTIMNGPDQGLCAWLMIHYRPGRALTSEGEHGRYCDGPADECYSPCGAPCWAEVSFDTSYGYRGDNGDGCGDLHARIVAELGQWLDAKSIPWAWKNGFTGDVHERYDGLTELGTGGAEASDWYRNIAAPAIAAHMAAGGSGG